jgi:hypothetical protein
MDLVTMGKRHDSLPFAVKVSTSSKETLEHEYQAIKRI